MRHQLLTSILILTLCVLVPPVNAQDDSAAFDASSIWLGGHYTEFSDYGKKVGEYRLIEDDAWAEFRLGLLSRRGNSLLSANGHFYDAKNVRAQVGLVTGRSLALDLRYRSLIHQLGQDLLSNLAAREAINGAPGGKMLTYTIIDSLADYNIHRQELLGKVDLLLSDQNDIRVIAAHRMILRDGTDQSLSNSHCFSCHQESRTRQVDNTTNNLEAGVQGNVSEGKVVGYQFGYRKFSSSAPDPTAPFDDAKHPTAITNTGTEAEFDSRLWYEDVTRPVNTVPETEKMAHKVRFKGDVGRGRVSTAFTYARAENLGTELSTNAMSGNVNYSRPLDERTRLLAKVYVVRREADDPLIDAPLFRQGRPGPSGVFANVDFDAIRYSVIDRLHARATAEVIRRVNPQWTLGVLGGYELIDRDDYPVVDEGLRTKRLIGQVTARYRKGLTYSSRVKYRIEKTSDPFTSGRGLFEYAGTEELTRPWAGAGSTFGFIFYFQREDLRYQSITTEPTINHEFEWSSNWQATPKVGVTIGARGYYDKNTDLDSLDVSHFSIAPNVNINLTPSDRLVTTVGYTYNHYKSRGPVTVALFDG